ncbi:FKBP-type peptidyl-prolyl cis-trans isomerase [Parvularcula bermudensis HTCC2503]|uniref:peptidylprolyl isomerase n=1 Tax=Parvularcula bermudensis (strain ATCC BAA-594 / HTCC2503 / KCTC 12087) TaxID=314260 RepID=E0TI40_PARBH|nr:FKBP-type peptidyl-prolyl cis-trans isomerase [Parvularcula bermudensis]ADM09379.1 FKBP-type peptidyl-prolyl cis-trans isomerase [Parvularcula bermudensis HTCC2503]
MRHVSLAALSAILLATGCGGDAPEEAAETTTATTEGESLDIPAAPNPVGERNVQMAQEFLQQNAERDEVRVLDSGLQLEVIEPGDGARPDREDLVRFHFSGQLLDGTVIQDSRAGGEPLAVPSPLVPQIESWADLPIPGLPLALAEMEEGSRVRAVIPPEIVSPEGQRTPFPEGTALIFDIELVEVVEEGNTARLAEVEAQQQELIDRLRAEQEAAQAAAQEALAQAAAANREASTAFLSEVRSREGIQSTASGLLYEVIEDSGNSESPEATDVVTVHYRGTLPDGQEFDSSYARGEPTSFPLDRVISGWTEGVALMDVGDKYKFYIPASLAYGEQGTPGGPIGPEQALVFEIELIDFEEPGQQGG